jgi:hypothetical protein
MTRPKIPNLRARVAMLPDRLASSAPRRAGAGDAGKYSVLYTHSRWRKLRLRQLEDEPACRMCAAEGHLVLASICDHMEPHRGDMLKFWSGPFQSLCKRHHDSTKQAQERSEIGSFAPKPRGD